jgi:glyoxylase-like metal-dependent hydrolase (beta-lactamase superfamily II)
MPAGDLYQVSRRTFLTEVGRGMFAIAVLGAGVVSCTTTAGDGSEETSATEGATSTTGSDTATSAAETSTTSEDASDGGVAVQRVALGNVSAYVLVRGREAVVVDTGNPGSEGDIEAGLSEVGLAWGHVGSVILTHRHPDHIGSVGPVMDAASQAFGYAGEADIPAIDTTRPLTPVGDGDAVFGLSIIETPGHTAGSISVYDPIGRVLVVGDAMNGRGAGVSGDGNGVAGANPRFSADMQQADESVRKLATLDFDAVYFGHGDPLEANGSALVADLAAGR